MERKNNAAIAIKNFQGGGAEDIVEIKTAGSFYEKNGAFYIIYEETEQSGMSGSVSMIKARGSSVTVSRRGAFASRAVYTPGTEYEMTYSMPYGSMAIKIKTKTVKNKLTAAGGELLLVYDTDIGGDIISNNMHITVKAGTAAI